MVRQAQSPTIRTQAIHVASPAEAQHLVATGVQQGAWVVQQIENIAAEPAYGIGWLSRRSGRYANGVGQEALRDMNATLEQQVTERTAQLRANEEALRQSQKMEAVINWAAWPTILTIYSRSLLATWTH